jgi:hypothetical protein
MKKRGRKKKRLLQKEVGDGGDDGVTMATTTEGGSSTHHQKVNPTNQQQMTGRRINKRKSKPTTTTTTPTRSNNSELIIRSPSLIGSWGGLQRVFTHPNKTIALNQQQQQHNYENREPITNNTNFFNSTPLRQSNRHSVGFSNVFSPSQFLTSLITPERSLIDSGIEMGASLLTTPTGATTSGRSMIGNRSSSSSNGGKLRKIQKKICFSIATD